MHLSLSLSPFLLYFFSRSKPILSPSLSFLLLNVASWLVNWLFIYVPIESEMFIIFSGSIEVIKAGRGLAQLLRAQCVGELALLQSASTGILAQPFTAVATAPSTTVLGLTRVMLDELMQESGAIGRGVLDALACALRWSYMQVG